MNIEIVQEHYLQDIYRLDNGILLTVNKFILPTWRWIDTLKNVKKEKIKGIKNCYKVKEDFTHWNEEYSTDSIFLDGYYILPVVAGEYEFRITANQGIIGDKEYIKKINNKIKNIMDKY